MPSDADPAVDSAERRQLSVLFVDLVGSTALSARLDPEEMRQIVRRYQNAVAGEVARFDGYVAKFMGDGVLAYFGWPKAHEDEAERAVRAAMAAVAAVGELRTGDGEALAARAGIATGLVVVGGLIGEGAAQEAAVIGDTPNIAARLQDLAQPGQVVIADSTQKFVQSSFDLVSLGLHHLKGSTCRSRPLPSSASGRATAASRRAPAAPAPDGRPRPGTGVAGRALGAGAERRGPMRPAGGRGRHRQVAHHAGVARQGGRIRQRHPALPMLALSPRQRLVAAHPADDRCPEDSRRGSAGDAARQDRNFLGRHAAHIESAVPLVANLLGVPYDDRYGPLNLSPQAQRSQTLAALVEQFLGLAKRRSVLVVMEDMHWTDRSTLEFIHLVLDRIEGQRILCC